MSGARKHSDARTASAAVAAVPGWIAPKDRRRLAPNVICMHAENRPPVFNIRRRGRYPRNVISIRSRPRLMPGDLAEICAGHPSNLGKRVRIVERATASYLPPGEWFAIEALCAPLNGVDFDTGQLSLNVGEIVFSPAQGLRRVSNRLSQ